MPLVCYACGATCEPGRVKFCSKKCASRTRKREQRRLALDVPAEALAIEIGLSDADGLTLASAWGVECDPEVAAIFAQDTGRRAKARSLRNNHDVTL